MPGDATHFAFIDDTNAHPLPGGAVYLDCHVLFRCEPDPVGATDDIGGFVRSAMSILLTAPSMGRLPQVSNNAVRRLSSITWLVGQQVLYTTSRIEEGFTLIAQDTVGRLLVGVGCGTGRIREMRSRYFADAVSYGVPVTIIRMNGAKRVTVHRAPSGSPTSARHLTAIRGT